LLDYQERRRVLMRASAKSNSAGFTLIEAMVVVAVLTILATMALPSFLQMLRNSEIRAAAESVANGLQRARAEAVSRNARVQFVLGAGTSWTVDYVTKPVLTDPPLDSRASTDGSANATLVSVAADLATAATTITYNQLGQVIPNADASPTISRVSIAATGGNTNLRVTIGAGGAARVCDPSLPLTNVRAC
jgi:type IV fimbrial biogenesis protein FimT